MAKLGLLVLLFLAIVAHAAASNVVQRGSRSLHSFDNEKMADNMQSFLRELPRYDFSLQPISNSWEPLQLSYYESLALIAAPFFGLGLLSIGFGLVMITLGVCCIAFFPRKKGGYSRCSRLLPALLLSFLSLLLLFIMCMGFYSEVAYHSSFYSAFNTVENITLYEMQLINDTLTSIYNYNGMGSDLIQSSIPDDLPQYSSAFTNYATILLNITSEIIFPIEDVRNWVILSCFLLITITAVLALIASLMRWGTLGYPILLLILIAISLCWLYSSFNVFLSVFLADMCPVIDEEIQSSFPSSVSEYVNFYLFCDGNAYELFFPLPEAIDSSVIALQLALQSTNNSTLEKKLQNDLTELTAIQTNMTALIQCSPTSTAFSSTQSLICINLFDGMFAITIAEVVAGVVMTASVYLVILAIRRWNYPKRMDDHYFPPLISKYSINDDAHGELKDDDRL